MRRLRNELSSELCISSAAAPCYVFLYHLAGPACRRCASSPSPGFLAASFIPDFCFPLPTPATFPLFSSETALFFWPVSSSHRISPRVLPRSHAPSLPRYFDFLPSLIFSGSKPQRSVSLSLRRPLERSSSPFSFRRGKTGQSRTVRQASFVRPYL